MVSSDYEDVAAPRRESTQDAAAVVVDRSEHSISRRRIPENVLKVLYRLHRSGYRAYLCGGSVRDLLLNRTPKDFDVATDAHPAEVRRLFRNSRIIGRRFRLVHVIFQDMVVEVSTFRREPERPVEENEDLLVTDDNTFGSPLQDARRRDFTINGLFYNIADFSVIDYVGGLADIEHGEVRVIGDPDLRFREDPVRMLRAVEFASRLGFRVESGTYQGILRHRGDILKASAPRVSEEILELLRRGWSRDAFRLMVDARLLEPLLPEIYRTIAGEGTPYFWKMLEVLDRTVVSGRKVPDPVLLSVLFLPWIMSELEKEQARREGRMRIGEVMVFIRELIQPVCARMALAAGSRHQIEQTVETLWRLLEPPSDRRAQLRFVYREPFNDALALLELYALSSGQSVEQFRQWRAFADRVRRSEAPAPPLRRRRRK
ncbi:MAG TPA: polynucleotide adenylyltransferase PcnB [Thermoanaerobaculia bacterium]|nr:polynucleotide adenylyltransferase PcnB [Thermoanaerobaculia bacterium]